MLMAIVPNGLVTRHRHAGDEVGYVLEGMIESIRREGPSKVFRQGDIPMTPVRTAQIAKAGRAGAKWVGTFVVEKDKPLASPAP